MPRPITLFTGQWADLPFEEVAKLASGWGYDGLEIACWGDHLDPWQADDDGYVQGKLDLLEKYGLKVYAISNHLKGQAVCDDPIDARHEAILSSQVWGDGDPEGVRQRAAEEMKMTARLAQQLGVKTVIGFTGSSIWKYVAMFPPATEEMVAAGYRDFADRWNPILDVFDECGVRFAHEVHPSEIAYDYWTTVATMEAIGHREAFGLNWDPSHFVWQDLDPVGFLWDFKDRIYHVDCKDAKRQTGNGRNGRLGSHLPWADPRRGWDFVSTGHGDVPWEQCFRMLNTIGYDGPISVEWEDAGMDRLVGAPEALEFVRRLAFDAPEAAFDAAFSTTTEPIGVRPATFRVYTCGLVAAWRHRSRGSVTHCGRGREVRRPQPAERAAQERATKSMPGGNTRSMLHYEPFPLAFERGEGAACGRSTATATSTSSASTPPASTATRTR